MKIVIVLALIATIGTAHAGSHINKQLVAQRKAEKAATAELDAAVDLTTLFTDEEIDKIDDFNKLRVYLKRLAKASESDVKKAKKVRKK